jgi:hypothetical protein
VKELDYSPALNEEGTEFDIVKAAEIAKAALKGAVSTDHGRSLCIHLPENFTAGEAKDVLLAALASSPAPAGLRLWASAGCECGTCEQIREHERVTIYEDRHYRITAAPPGTDAALASSPAPAGLDRNAVLDEVMDVIGSMPAPQRMSVLLYRSELLNRLLSLRAVTRPAEDAGA